MSILTTVLPLVAFACLVLVGVAAWQCMKLTRGDAGDPAALDLWLRRLGAALVGLLVFGGLYLLLSWLGLLPV